jgi:hypothetical protein
MLAALMTPQLKMSCRTWSWTQQQQQQQQRLLLEPPVAGGTCAGGAAWQQWQQLPWPLPQIPGQRRQALAMTRTMSLCCRVMMSRLQPAASLMAMTLLLLRLLASACCMTTSLQGPW